MRQPRQQVGAGRCDEDALGPARQLDMAHRRFRLRVPAADPHALAGQRLERGGRDEMGSRLGHHHAHFGVEIT